MSTTTIADFPAPMKRQLNLAYERNRIINYGYRDKASPVNINIFKSVRIKNALKNRLRSAASWISGYS